MLRLGTTVAHRLGGVVAVRDVHGVFGEGGAGEQGADAAQADNGVVQAVVGSNGGHGVGFAPGTATRSRRTRRLRTGSRSVA